MAQLANIFQDPQKPSGLQVQHLITVGLFFLGSAPTNGNAEDLSQYNLGY